MTIQPGKIPQSESSGALTAIIHALSEEHGWVSIGAADPGLQIGQRVEIIPNHICPAVNLMDELTIIRAGRVVDLWPVAARGKIR